MSGSTRPPRAKVAIELALAVFFFFVAVSMMLRGQDEGLDHVSSWGWVVGGLLLSVISLDKVHRKWDDLW